MAQYANEVIKLAAGAIVLLMIFGLFFNEDGIFSKSFKYITYAEPLLLQRHLAAMIETSSTLPGTYSGSILVTGEAYTIKLYRSANIGYIDVSTSISEYRPNVDTQGIDPAPILTDCVFETRELVLEKDITKVVNFRKTTNSDGTCSIYLSKSI